MVESVTPELERLKQESPEWVSSSLLVAESGTYLCLETTPKEKKFSSKPQYNYVVFLFCFVFKDID